MNTESRSFKKRFHSLSVRLPLLFVSTCVVLVAIVTAIVYFRFKSRMIDEYTRMAKGITNLMAHELDASKIDEYMEKNFEMAEYNEILERFYDLKDNYPDILYMYVYHIREEGSDVIFDLDSEEGGAADAPGSLYEHDKAFLPYVEDLCAGREIPALVGTTPDGYLLTYVRPVFDDEGTYRCYACVDFSMDYIHSQDLRMIYSLLCIMVVAVALILFLDIYVVRRSITGPINEISKCSSEFTYDTEENRYRNIQLLENLNIHTKDEIENLYLVFMTVMKESLYYMSNLSRAIIDIQAKEEKLDQMSETAYKDAMTGVGNKAAYNQKVTALNQEIARQEAEFAIVMVDINNLKYVNDTFGHEAGDNYIKGCCHIVCDCYKKSPVYRIGGDEFVVILKGEDYKKRQICQMQMVTAFMDAYKQQDVDVWQRYSASVGMSECTPEDESVEQVFKRADDAMYEYKMKFKEKYGSYR